MGHKYRATVHQFTGAACARVRRLLSVPQTQAMSFILLHRLIEEEAQLPIHLTSGADIDMLRVMMLAGLVKGTIPPPVRTLTGHAQPPAAVHEVTRLGHLMASRFPLSARSR